MPFFHSQVWLNSNISECYVSRRVASFGEIVACSYFIVLSDVPQLSHSPLFLKN